MTGHLLATTYVKFWVNGGESPTLTQGDQFAWEFDVSVNGGSGDCQLILDLDGNGVFNESDVLLTEFEQTDGVSGNDGPGDSDETENGIVYSELGSFGFAAAHYIFIVTDTSDSSQAEASFQILPLQNPKATVSGNISKADIAAPSSELANIMIITQMDQGFAGYWTGLTNDQGNYTINLPDTAVGTVWNVELFSENTGKYIVSDRYERVTFHSGVNSGFNFIFNLPSSYVYGQLIDEKGNDVNVNDYAVLTNENTNEDFYSELVDGHFNVPVAFETGHTSAQFRLHLWGDNLPPDYMIPQFWSNEEYLLTVNEGDSVEKNITVQHTDEEIYVQILKEGGPPGMAFDVRAYDDQGETYTITSDNGQGTLSVKGTGSYYIFISFDNSDLEPLPPGYTFDGGTNTTASAGDTAKFNIIAATSSISGSISFAEGDPQVSYSNQDFNIQIEESQWQSSQSMTVDESLNYIFYVTPGTYRVWLENYTNDFLAMPYEYDSLQISSDTLENIDFKLNYRHANLNVKLKNAPFNTAAESWRIYTTGQSPNIYQIWAYGAQDSIYNFKICDGEWIIQAPYADTSLSLKLNVKNDVTNYFVTIDYDSKEITTGLKVKAPAITHKFELFQNYPNPFNPITRIDYQLAKYGHVTLTVYDIVGREVKTLVNAYQNAGKYSVNFDAGQLASGVYFYKLVSSTGFIQLHKMLLVK